jgi:hypothetical protein
LEKYSCRINIGMTAMSYFKKLFRGRIGTCSLGIEEIL